MMYETIKTAVADRIAVLTFNRPDVLNAFNGRMVEEVSAAMAELGRPADVLAIVVHGEGRAFSAGFDLKESAGRGVPGVAEWRTILEKDFDFIVQFWDCPKPTIAAIHGYCLAGASELALACDMPGASVAPPARAAEVRAASSLVSRRLPLW